MKTPATTPLFTLLLLVTSQINKIHSLSSTTTTTRHKYKEQTKIHIDDDTIEEAQILSKTTNRRKFIQTIAGASVTSGILLTTRKEEDTCNAAETSSSTTTASGTTTNIYDILSASSKKAIKGGKAGASAAVVQVLALMWLRTIMNYQYRYGGTISNAFSTLYNEGGVARLYQGLPFAIVQGPMTRFGDTATNMGMLALLDTLPATSTLPLFAKTLAGSLAAGGFRIVLMPIDTSKTVLQVEGRQGFNNLLQDIKQRKTLSPFYRGAIATAAATAVGHYPWFLTYNALDQYLPVITDKSEILLILLRSAFLGIAASCTSDVCSNSLRVIKTTKQTAALNNSKDNNDAVPVVDLSYVDTVKSIIEKDGIGGLFGRGLRTRLITNTIQGALFSVLWKYFQTVQS